MPTAVHRPYSIIAPEWQALLLDLIREEYTPLLHAESAGSVPAWHRAVTAADPTLFLCGDGVFQLHVGEGSQQRLLAFLCRTFEGTHV